MAITCGGARLHEHFTRRRLNSKGGGREGRVRHGTKKERGKHVRIRAAGGAWNETQHGPNGPNSNRGKETRRTCVPKRQRLTDETSKADDRIDWNDEQSEKTGLSSFLDAVQALDDSIAQEKLAQEREDFLSTGRGLQTAEVDRDEPSTLNTVQEMLKAAEVGNVDEVERLLNGIENDGLQPGPRAFHALATAASVAGDAQSAIDAVRRAVASGVRPIVETYLILMMAFLGEDDLPRAEKVLAAMGRAGHSTRLGWIALTTALFKKGKFDEANYHFQAGRRRGLRPTADLFEMSIKSLVLKPAGDLSGANGRKYAARSELACMRPEGVEIESRHIIPIIEAEEGDAGMLHHRERLFPYVADLTGHNAGYTPENGSITYINGKPVGGTKLDAEAFHALMKVGADYDRLVEDMDMSQVRPTPMTYAWGVEYRLLTNGHMLTENEVRDAFLEYRRMRAAFAAVVDGEHRDIIHNDRVCADFIRQGKGGTAMLDPQMLVGFLRSLSHLGNGHELLYVLKGALEDRAEVEKYAFASDRRSEAEMTAAYPESLYSREQWFAWADHRSCHGRSIITSWLYDVSGKRWRSPQPSMEDFAEAVFSGTGKEVAEAAISTEPEVPITPHGDKTASKLTVAQIREELQALGLNPEGVRAEIYERLQEARRANPALMRAISRRRKAAASKARKAKNKDEEWTGEDGYYIYRSGREIFVPQKQEEEQATDDDAEEAAVDAIDELEDDDLDELEDEEELGELDDLPGGATATQGDAETVLKGMDGQAIPVIENDVEKVARYFGWETEIRWSDGRLALKDWQFAYVDLACWLDRVDASTHCYPLFYGNVGGLVGGYRDRIQFLGGEGLKLWREGAKDPSLKMWGLELVLEILDTVVRLGGKPTVADLRCILLGAAGIEWEAAGGNVVRTLEEGPNLEAAQVGLKYVLDTEPAANKQEVMELLLLACRAFVACKDLGGIEECIELMQQSRIEPNEDMLKMQKILETGNFSEYFAESTANGSSLDELPRNGFSEDEDNPFGTLGSMSVDTVSIDGTLASFLGKRNYEADMLLSLGEDSMGSMDEEYLTELEEVLARQDSGSTDGLRSPRSAFVIFSSEMQEHVRSADPDLSYTEIAGKLRDMWLALPPEDKRTYMDRAEEELSTYRQQLERYLRSE